MICTVLTKDEFTWALQVTPPTQKKSTLAQAVTCLRNFELTVHSHAQKYVVFPSLQEARENVHRSHERAVKAQRAVVAAAEKFRKVHCNTKGRFERCMTEHVHGNTHTIYMHIRICTFRKFVCVLLDLLFLRCRRGK